MIKPIPVNNKYLISVQRPHLWIMTALGIILVLVLLFWLSFDYGRRTSGFHISETEALIDSLEAQVEELKQQNEDLLRDKTKLSREIGIDKDASSQVTKTLAEKQSEILEMKEELTFYRSVVSPKTSKRTLEVKKVDFTAAGNNEYKYKIVLIQEGKHDVAARGVVEFTIEGAQSDGSVVRLDWPTVSTEKVEKQQRFGFKYFQNFEGGIRIPDNFDPKSIYVRVLPSGSTIPKIEEVYDWGKLMAGGEQINVGQTEN